MEYPEERYQSAYDYFSNEEEWDTLENYCTIYKRAKEYVGDPNFYFNCGSSSVKYMSLGMIRYFKRALGGPKIAFERAAPFNKHFNDTKEFTVLIKPGMVKGKMRITYKIKFHDDIDPHFDYCSDPHIKGILSSIPEIWGLPAAKVYQPLVEYDPVKLLSSEYSQYNLNAYLKDGFLYLSDPISGKEKKYGKEVCLISENLPDKFSSEKVAYLGKYSNNRDGVKAILVTNDLVIDDDKILTSGTIYKAPYFVIIVEWIKLTFLRKIPLLLKLHQTKKEMTEGLSFYLNQTRNAVKARNDALKELHNYAQELELKVSERTSELDSAYSKLKEFDKLKSNFFANVSHEIRTPLTLIIAPIESVLQKNSKGNIDDNFFKGLHRNSVRLLELINTMLDFSKIEASRMTMRIKKVDLVKNIQFLLGTIHSACESYDINISFISLNKKVEAYIDLNKFEKIVMNLFSNAVKFTDIGGKISIRLKDDSDWCYFEIEDTGVGIPSDKLESIFDRFAQINTISKRKYEGTGIGLSLVKELVEMHNGTITAESKYYEEYPEEHGTIISISIPKGKVHFDNQKEVILLDEDEIEESVSDSWQVRLESMLDNKREDIIEIKHQDNSKVINQSNNRLLVVEDNREMRLFMSNLLTDQYIVETAENGKQGYNKAKELRPDLIITDVMMPIINGYEMTQMIKNDKEINNIPIIMLTAKTDIDHKVEGLEYGADDYLTKPFNSKELIARINSLLKMSKLQNDLIDLNKNLEGQVQTQLQSLAKAETLKRYLPSQLVNSIISGEQDINLATERKKTFNVFFRYR